MKIKTRYVAVGLREDGTEFLGMRYYVRAKGYTLKCIKNAIARHVEKASRWHIYAITDKGEWQLLVYGFNN